MNDHTRQTAWDQLAAHYAAIANTTLSEHFAADPQRFQHCHLRAADLLLDFSKQPIDNHTVPLLCELAHAYELPKQRDKLFAGELINVTEQRPALHAAWRWPTESAFPAAHCTEVVAKIRQQLLTISRAIRQGDIAGITGKAFTDIIHIGIGGSGLGPKVLYDVTHWVDSRHLRVHFVETIDASQLHNVLKHCDAETTAVVIASKSFTTAETRHNTGLTLDWLQQQLPSYDKHDLIQSHCFAVTSNLDKAHTFGIASQHVFALPDWIGGRYSVWSAISFSIMASIGEHLFDDFLQGAYAMDQHFLTAPLENNMPVVYGLLRIWLRQFYHMPYHAVLPYAYDLRQLPAYLQQLEMESNGKSVRCDHQPVTHSTAPLLWGGVETQAQHSVHQWLHQGTDPCPIDFIACASFELNPHAQSTADQLFAHCLSQSATLMHGKTQAECKQQCGDDTLAHHQTLPGNRPSNTIMLSQLNTRTLGALLALYEHATFVQSVIWQINPFDQWGVEEGKQLAKQLHIDLLKKKPADTDQFDASTAGLMAFYQKNK